MTRTEPDKLGLANTFGPFCGAAGGRRCDGAPFMSPGLSRSSSRRH